MTAIINGMIIGVFMVAWILGLIAIKKENTKLLVVGQIIAIAMFVYSATGGRIFP